MAREKRSEGADRNRRQFGSADQLGNSVIQFESTLMRPNVQTSDWREAEEAIRAYGKARKILCDAQERLAASGLLSGNDNKVGLAGEFWAKLLYHNRGYELTSIEASNNEGFDFCCLHAGKEMRISVKVISKESESGRQMPLKASEAWDELCVLLLTQELTPYRYGRATREDFETAQKNKAIGETPRVSRSWVEPKGWISRYGKVEDWK